MLFTAKETSEKPFFSLSVQEPPTCHQNKTVL